MNIPELIEQVIAEGVDLALSSAGTIKASGDQSIVDKWLPAIRDNKLTILSELHRERRRTKLLAMMDASPDKRYSMLVEDSSVDPVIVTVGINSIATFELEIPHRYYDGVALLELIEKQIGEKHEEK